MFFLFIKFDGSLGRWWENHTKGIPERRKKGKKSIKGGGGWRERKQEEALISFLCAYSLIPHLFLFYLFFRVLSGRSFLTYKLLFF